MISFRFILLALFCGNAVWAANPDSTVPGEIAANHEVASSPSGPLLALPSNGSEAVVDSSDMVHPVAYAAGATPLPPAPPAPPVDETPSSSPASENVTVNLIHLMVKKGLISKDDASDLVKQAQKEAVEVHERAVVAAAKGNGEAAPHNDVGPDGMLAAPPASANANGGSDDDSVSVAYVPNVVKNQIRDEVKADVLKQAHDEGWGTPDPVPEWVHRFRITGDIRLRYEDTMFPSGNAIGGGLINFNAINTSGNGLTVNPALLPNSLPQFNADQKRNRFRLRARLGAEIDLGNNFTSGIRVATGSDNSPVTENQTFGGTTGGGQGGNFSKYQIWLDRAFLRYEVGRDPDKSVAVTIGRFENPFFHTTMIYANDLGFDGVVAQGRYKVADNLVPFLTAGAFPIFNTDLNFSTDQSAKFRSEDKYLFGTQAGTTWKIDKDFSAKGAVAFYDFEDVQGKVSDAIPIASASAVGNTDDSRPSFAQNGNTYIALRNFTDPNPADAQDQYFGLASAFRELVLTGELDFSRFDPFHMALTGEVVKNVAFDRNQIVNGGPGNFSGPQNNTTNASDPNSYDGGDTGYFVSLNMGKVDLEQFGDWNIFLTYRYVESDATVDGFTDSDFGGPLVGTNLQGYTIGGDFALAKRVSVRLAWMSADSIAGPSYKNDLIQLDLNARF